MAICSQYYHGTVMVGLPCCHDYLSNLIHLVFMQQYTLIVQSPITDIVILEQAL